MARIFISYRRADSAGHVGRLYDHLSARFGAGNIFIDLDAIPPGADFVATIETAIAESDWLLAVIGPQWLSLRAANGARRIDDPADFVRLEIATALARNSRVVPVLVGDAAMPGEHELPAALAPLARRNAIEVSDSRWAFDVGRLIDLLDVADAPAPTNATTMELPTPGPSNLPAQLTTLVGREDDIAAISSRLEQPDVRLLTLTGPGGIGKSVLALAVAERQRAMFRDGVWLVPLASISDPQLVPTTIAEAFGLQEDGTQSIVAALKRTLRPSRTLLLLDNFEHLTGVAPLLNELLQAAPHLKILVTSRARLRLSGEHEYPLAPLDLPERDHDSSVEELARYGAVDLFVRRARAVRPQFELTATVAPVVVECCRRLDGLPLAIELAAARCRMLPPQAILQRLEQRLKLLTGGARDLPTRQQTLRGAIDWSYELLTPTEQQLFARLGVFTGGFSLDAAAIVCDPEGDLDAMEGLQSLLDKSLVRQDELADHEYEPRFRMLETIREYALERLAESGDIDLLRRQHSAYMLELAEQAVPELTGNQQDAWLHRLALEHDNFRAALEWTSRPGSGLNEQALRLSGALWRFWEIRGHLSEGRAWLTRSIDQARLGDWSAIAPEARAHALNGAGNLAWTQGDYATARTLHEECLALRRETDDRLGVATSLGNLGIVARAQGDTTAARALYGESLSLRRRLGDARGVAAALNSLAGIALDEGDDAGASDLYEEGLLILRELGDMRGEAFVLGNLGTLRLHQGDVAAARSLYENSLSLRRELGDRRGIATVLNNLGVIALEQADLTTARSLYQESLALRRELGDRDGIATSLANLGWIALEQGDPAEAGALYAESLRLHRDLADWDGIALGLEGLANVAHARQLPERATRLSAALAALLERREEIRHQIDEPRLRQAMAQARAELGEQAWSAAWAAGQALAPDQAIHDALQDTT
jgi:predicted ATPase